MNQSSVVMVSSFEYGADYSELEVKSKILTLFVDVLNFVDRQDKIIKGSVTRQVCRIDNDTFEVSLCLSNADDVSWFVNAFLSQCNAFGKTEENLFEFHIYISPVGSKFDITYKVFMPLPY